MPAIFRPTVTHQRVLVIVGAIVLVSLSGLLLSSFATDAIIATNRPCAPNIREDDKSKIADFSLVPDTTAPGATHLILVAAHAIWKGGPPNVHAGESPSEWNLKDFQAGQQETFIKHIEVGAQLAMLDEDAVMVFSGGQTDAKTGPISEGQSYWNLAMARPTFPETSNLPLRMTTEEYARDSYENLLFSICRFHEFTGSYPRKITVVSHSFKGKRFEKLHRAAIRFPRNSFKFVGINPPGEPPLQQERENAVLPFLADPYGCVQPLLISKRVVRNPFRRHAPYLDSCPELYGLLTYCSSNGNIYEGSLPWDEKTLQDDVLV
ncbi:hypothetical protein V1512DRAFT_255866 [Lipomyces arxii]|uniref:uncharacterized protein n=1 Tax=Lipomyces arxii TaxID=56418 RepID=UPI0034CF2F99